MKVFNILHKYVVWLGESNRRSHLTGGLLLGLLFTFFCALGAAIGMEFKDCQFDRRNAGYEPWRWTWRCWGWADFGMTVLGGAIGGAVNILILTLIF